MIKRYLLIVLPIAFMTIAFADDKPIIVSNGNYTNASDSLPDICSIILPGEVDALKPFGIPLSKSFPDPNNYETYSGCQYQFFTPAIKPQMALRVLKFDSKTESTVAYRSSINSHTNDWYGIPERIYNIADSAYFNYEGEDTAKCDECGLVVLQDLYNVYISFKGAYDESSRAGKKFVALQILQMLYDRIPGLAPSRIRNIK